VTPLQWAAQAWERPVVSAQLLVGGWTSTMLRLEDPEGERAVLRLMTKEPWRTHAEGLIRREVAIQRRLAQSPIPAPATWAADPTGAAAGEPAHLMSWLPGRLELGRDDDALLHALAAMLTTIHRHDPGAGRPRAFQSWAPPARRVVPTWAGDPAVWVQAFALLDRPPPDHEPVFLHRDFHLGNVLWIDGAITGVVDWVETSWGPAGLDVAHCATYAALLHGADAAARFVAAYAAGAGLDAPAQRYWDVMDVVGYLPDPTKVAAPWRAAGRPVSDDLARARLEDRLAAVLS
jgi:aminoglycoside phosphotransferase (APT) family kinase protein